jgi:hypothetical protein
MPRLADRFQTLPAYPLAHVPVRKRELLAAGRDVIDLGAGDADLMPPPAALAAMREALDDSAMHRYGFGLGHVPFREAVAGWMQRRFGLSFDPVREVCPLIGSKEGIVHLCQAFLQRGEVAVVPEPGYLAYLGGALLGEAEVVPYPLRPRTRFLVELEELPADVLRRTKLVFLNYPNNPTSAVAPRDYLQRVVNVCRERDILLVYDNAYSEFGYDGYVPPSIFEVEGRARGGGRVPLAEQDVQHDRLAAGVGRRARRRSSARSPRSSRSSTPGRSSPSRRPAWPRSRAGRSSCRRTSPCSASGATRRSRRSARRGSRARRRAPGCTSGSRSPTACRAGRSPTG